jgi:Flp pilus assembly protein TadG
MRRPAPDSGRGPSTVTPPLATRDASRGQSIVEFALVLPILMILLLAIVDFARLYTTVLTVESAAREAADYGAFHWYNWQDSTAANATEAEMERRACVAIRNLPEYSGPVDSCMTPSFFNSSLDAPPSGPSTNCALKPDPSQDPCRVTVTLQYSFELLAPINIELFGVALGLPDSIPFSRTATFALSDFGIDAP